MMAVTNIRGYGPICREQCNTYNFSLSPSEEKNPEKEKKGGGSLQLEDHKTNL